MFRNFHEDYNVKIIVTNDRQKTLITPIIQLLHADAIVEQTPDLINDFLLF